MSIDLRRIEQSLEPHFAEASELEEIRRLICDLEPRWRNFVLGWVSAASQSHPEIARQFARQAGDALQMLGRDGCQRWLQAALDVFDQDGLSAAVESLENLDRFIRDQRKRSRGLALEAVQKNFQYAANFLEGEAANSSSKPAIRS